MAESYEIENILKELDLLFLRHREGNIYKTVLEALERSLITNALRITFGNQLKAARLLGINRNTLHTKVKKLNIDAKTFK